jgi:ribonuclease P protein component
MKKGQNSSTDIAEKPGQTLPRSKILRGKRNFQRLFERSSVIKAPSVQFRYRIYKNPDEGCMIGFIVMKRLGNAAKRNKIKRLIREAYRTNQHLLSDLFSNGTFGLHGVFMARHTNVTYQSIQADVVQLLEKLRETLMKKMNSQELKQGK